MKSVLQNLATRIEEQHGEEDANGDPEDLVRGAGSTKEQLAELRLLSRVEHEVSPSPPYPGSETMTDGSDFEKSQDPGEEGRVEKSAFTALLGESTKRASQQSAFPPAIQGVVASNPVAKNIGERSRRASVLPTLCEESTEEMPAAAAEVPDGTSGSNPLAEDEMEILTRSAKSHPVDLTVTVSENEEIDELRSSHEDQESDDFTGSRDEYPESSDHEEEEDGEAFTQMLSRLAQDFSFLTLSMSDVTVRRLSKVRDALAQAAPPHGVAPDAESTERERSSSPTSRSDSAPNSTPSLSKMRHLRTVLAIDTIRMLLHRHAEADVLLAITNAVRQIFEQHALEHGIEPLAHAPIVLTSSNVTRAALLARQSLASDSGSFSPKSNNSHRHRCPPSSCAFSASPKPSQHQAPSPRKTPTVGTTARIASASPRQARNPASATTAASIHAQASPTRSGPTTPQRRSILASEGTHVLLQEKIGAFQYRGSSNGLPLFKVRRDGVASTEAAAKRRQRSIAYGNEQTRKVAKEVYHSLRTHCTKVESPSSRRNEPRSKTSGGRMVHIINGEIVQDNDPRVLARKQPQGDAASRRRPVAGLGSLSSSSGSGGSESAGGAPPQHAAPHGAPASPLQSLARMLGIEGAVTIPAFLSFPARQVEKIHLALAALMVFLFGWRALIFLAFAFFLSSQQPAPPQQRQ